jgi:uncharacterized protein
MKWSKFNHLYFSLKHNKNLLYNSLSNVFIDVSNIELEQILKDIKEKECITELQDCPDLFEELKKAKIIVDSDETEILKIKHRLFLNRYSPYILNLTILPTLSCNFRCPYCFTKEGDGTFMDKLVYEKICKLVKNLTNNNKSTSLHLSWMGGEPLLDFNTIKELTMKLKELDGNINALLVTNGYLMNREKIEQFKELDISRVQITLDGLQEEHNLTRIHKTDADSFSKIISNMDTFFEVYNNRETVSLNVRVNLDRTKDYLRKFIEVYKFLRKRYPFNNLFISPGFIEDIKSNGFNISCEFDKASVKNFFVDLVKIGLTEYSLYPENQVFDCAVKSANSFVIGPTGELYSCWENIGFNEYITGFLNEEGLPVITNNESFFRYLIDADFLNDQTCLDCFFFPICTGGCPEKRIRNKHCNACFDICAVQKNAIEEILDLHYEVKLKKQTKHE